MKMFNLFKNNAFVNKFINHIRLLIHLPNIFKRKRIFCISMQRNGTTSTGKFLQDHGYRVQHWGYLSEKWANRWIYGDYERIFKTFAFRSFQAYEDNPWWFPDFCRVIHSRFPKAKFILFHRDQEKWFASMSNHSGGKTLGNTYRHCIIYRRLDDYYKIIGHNPDFSPSDFGTDNLLSLEGKHEHYIKIYEEYHRNVINYFNTFAPDKLFVCRLEDKNKWQKLGEFLEIKVSDDYWAHINKSVF